MSTHILQLNTGQDTAGGSYRTKRAFDRHMPDWAMRAMNAASPNSPGAYLQYPADLVYGVKAAAQRWYDWADVVHTGNTLHVHDFFDKGQGKPVVLHHHGTIFRLDHVNLGARARAMGAVQLSSTLDLTLLEPDVTWAPTPFDQPWLRTLRAPQADGTIRVAHAPTNRIIKSTQAVIAACESLRDRGYAVSLDLIEGVSWQECLRRKARADVFVDQVILGYGCNAIEAWGMGLPVIAGAEDPLVRAAMVERWQGLPFYEATEGTLAERILDMVKSPALRDEYAQRGMEHVQRWHDEAVVVAQLSDIYRNAPRTVPVGRPVRRLVTGAERRAQATVA